MLADANHIGCHSEALSDLRNCWPCDICHLIHITWTMYRNARPESKQHIADQPISGRNGLQVWAFSNASAVMRVICTEVQCWVLQEPGLLAMVNEVWESFAADKATCAAAERMLQSAACTCPGHCLGNSAWNAYSINIDYRTGKVPGHLHAHIGINAMMKSVAMGLRRSPSWQCTSTVVMPSHNAEPPAHLIALVSLFQASAA